MIPVAIFLLYCIYYYIKGPLIVPYPEIGFVEQLETNIIIVMIPIFAFVLPNKYEIELSLICGTSTPKLFFSKVISALLYTAVPAFVCVLLYRYVPYEGSGRIRIPLYVPDNFRIYLAVSLAVTILFFLSAYLFIRVVSRNCYVPILLGLCLHFATTSNTDRIRRGLTDIKRSIFDPFISIYFIGDEVPNAIAAKYAELSVLENAWTYNRLIFLGVSVVLLVATYLLLRREKLHCGFGD